MLALVSYFNVFEKSIFMLIKATYFIRNALKQQWYCDITSEIWAVIINVENSSA